MKKARAVMTEMVENCVDRMKTSAGDIDVISLAAAPFWFLANSRA